MTFDYFKATVAQGIASGAIKLSKPLSELDLAIQYALDEEMEARGAHPLEATAEDIAQLIIKHCGRAVYDRVLPAAE